MALRKFYSINGNASVSIGGTSIDVENFVGSINDAYIKIDSLTAHKSNLTLFVGIYKDGKKKGNSVVSMKGTLDGDNFIKQGYLHLKTLPEFAGAEDC